MFRNELIWFDGSFSFMVQREMDFMCLEEVGKDVE